MKRLIAVFMALLLMASITTNALALETWLFNLDYETGAADVIGALNGSDGSDIQLFPFANNDDPLSEITFTYMTEQNGIADLTEADLQSNADLMCMSIEAMKDGTSIYTDAEPFDTKFIMLDGNKAGYLAIKAKWNSANIAGASTDLYFGTFMVDFGTDSLGIICVAPTEAAYNKLIQLVQTITWNDVTAATAAQTGVTRLGTVYDYGDFSMAYTPGGMDIAGEKSSEAFLYNIHPFAESGDTSTAVMIMWQEAPFLDLNALSSKDLQVTSTVMLEGLVAGMAQSGLECDSELLSHELISLDGYTALRVDGLCTYDLSAYGLGTMSVYISYYQVPVDFAGGVYNFCGIANSNEQLDQVADLLETITWNK